MDFLNLGAVSSGAGQDAIRKALRIYYRVPGSELYTPARGWVAENFENQITEAYYPRAVVGFGDPPDVDEIAHHASFKQLVDSFVKFYPGGQSQTQAPASSDLFGRPLTSGEKTALAAGGGLLALGLLLLVTRRS